MGPDTCTDPMKVLRRYAKIISKHLLLCWHVLEVKVEAFASRPGFSAVVCVWKNRMAQKILVSSNSQTCALTVISSPRERTRGHLSQQTGSQQFETGNSLEHKLYHLRDADVQTVWLLLSLRGFFCSKKGHESRDCLSVAEDIGIWEPIESSGFSFAPGARFSSGCVLKSFPR